MRKKPLGYYNYTVILTYCGLLFGVVGIFYAVRGSFLDSIICLMSAGMCDMFDGLIASTKKDRTEDEKRFGIQIDSLSDLICFGALPAVFVFCLDSESRLSAAFAALFILATLIRLAYFNVSEEDRQKDTREKRKSYLGIPVTTVALLLPAVYALYEYRVFRTKIAFLVLLAFLAVGFICPIKIKKPSAFGKVGLVVAGIAEFLALIFMMGVDPM